jgi:hypothetical protein
MRWVLFRYARAIAFRELVRAPRWAPEDRGMALFATGALVSGPVVVLGPLSYVWWLVTGGGPIRWLRLMRYPNVNPFKTGVPGDVMAATRRKLSEPL